MSDGGSIILNASIVSMKGIPAFGVYSATKAAVRSFARTWIMDLKGKGIRVNVVSPGPIDTPGMRGLNPDEAQTQAVRRRHDPASPSRPNRPARGHRQRRPFPRHRRKQLRQWHRAVRRRRHGAGVRRTSERSKAAWLFFTPTNRCAFVGRNKISAGFNEPSAYLLLRLIAGSDEPCGKKA